MKKFKKVPVLISMSISKSFDICVAEGKSVEEAALSSIELPTDLAFSIREAIFNYLIIDNTAWLKETLYQCDNWHIDDLQIIEENE